eukprot:6660982-Lingulodinium_polyedra.AAC.1
MCIRDRSWLCAGDRLAPQPPGRPPPCAPAPPPPGLRYCCPPPPLLWRRRAIPRAREGKGGGAG